MHVGDNLRIFLDGIDLVARFMAHEIAQNLDLSHVSRANKLMNDGPDLNASEITTIVNSSFTQ